MKIELKNIKHFAAGSEETYCYTASLWVDGKRIGEVSNDGHGGCDRFYGDQAAYAEADAWCKANLPHWTLEEAGEVIFKGETSLEHHCTDLVTDWLRRKDFLRAKRGKIVFLKPDAKGLYQVPYKGDEASAIAEFRTLRPGTTILNDMDIDAALKIYVENTEHV